MNIKRLIQKKFFEDYCFNNRFTVFFTKSNGIKLERVLRE